MRTLKKITKKINITERYWIKLYLSSMAYLGIMLLLLCSSCALFRPIPITELRTDMWVTTMGKDTTCVKKPVYLKLSATSVIYDSLKITKLEFYGHNQAFGYANGVQYDVTMANTRTEPYYLLIKSDTLAIVIGFQCYTDKK